MNEVYNALIENYPELIIVTDLEGIIIDVSNSFIKTYRIEKKEEIMGKSILDLLIFQDRERAKSNFTKIIEKKSIKNQVYRFINSDGQYFLGLTNSCLIPDLKEKTSAVFTIVKNISNYERIEADLKESQKMFQLVIDNIPQFIFWKDLNSVYLGCNKNFARVAGVGKPENIIGKKDQDLVWRDSESEFFYEIDRLVMELDKPEYHVIETQLQADGKQAWLDTNRIPLHNEENEVVGVLGTYEDITDRVKARKKLEKSEKKYREAYNQANFYKDIFSHDISNILQNIQSANDLLNIYLNSNIENRIEDRINDLVDISKTIKEQIMRGARLINNIQKLSYIEESRINIKKLDLFDILNESLRYISNWKYKYNVNIQVDTPHNSLYVYANHFLKDIFENILINAIKYNNNKIVEIKINLKKKKRAERNYIQLDFIDNGIGIKDVRKEKIFQRAYNKDKSISGLGLGLSLVKKIIESYNGFIWVEDRIPGYYSKGTKVILMIPEAQ
ncbi:MAG: PAS domain S-box protein [Candidatus Lokiarchaeota archaeon]|nr:PAS domain S-box protein [Candidatus Lokiarchaeota archaeon]